MGILNEKEVIRVDSAKKLEPYFTYIGLSNSQISSYSIEQLESYLKTVEDLIKDPQKLGFPEDLGSINIRVLGVKANLNILIISVLLEKKRLILDRITTLRSQEKIATLRDLVARKVNDSDAQGKLLQELQSLENEAQKLREINNKTEEELAVSKQDTEIEL